MRGVVERDVLLGYQPRAYASAQMCVEEACHLNGTDVAAALEEAACEGGNGIAVCVDKVGEDGGEFDLVIERGDVRVRVRKKCGEGVLVVGVDAGDVWVRNNDVG